MKRNQSWINTDFDDDDDAFIKAEAKPTSSSLGKRKRENAFSLGDSWKTRRLVEEDNKLWSQNHEPKKSEELAVHVKKIEEVRGWILGSFSRKHQNKSQILLMRGPPGSGKTITVRVIAKELGINIQEWVSPNEVVEFKSEKFDDFNAQGRDVFSSSDQVSYTGQKSTFKNFLLRASRYQALDGLDNVQNGASGQQIVLLEDIPAFAHRDSGEFHALLAAYKSSPNSFPMIIIQSESNRDDGKKKKKSTLFNDDAINQLQLDEINFNPVATTNLVKALKNIATMEAEKGVRAFKIPEKEALTSLAESSGGDIRGAINALQFACLKDVKDCFESQLTLCSKKSKKTSRKPSKDAPSTLSAIGSKDPSLDLFHAMGKVLYAKRFSDQKELFDLPRGDPTLGRCKLQFNPEEVLSKAPMSEDSFACFLHQNYPDFFSSISDLAAAAEQLSLSDELFNEWTTCGKVSLSEYGGLVVIRGIAFNNTKVASQNGMKKFSKPDWYQKNRINRARLDKISSSFRQNCPSSREAATVLLPVLSSHFPASISKDLAEIGHFSGISSIQSSYANRNQTFLAPKPVQKVIEKNEEDDDCDFNIEED